MTQNQYNNQKDFQEFAKSMKAIIDRYTGKKKLASDSHFEQVTKLLALEKLFLKTLNADPAGLGIYQEFIRSIVFDRGNILTARPYFRERQKKFSKYISPALKKEDAAELSKYHVNYQFAAFVIKHAQPPLKLILSPIVRQIKNLRNEIVELNMPLAINRARVFFSRTHRSHLTYMDLVLVAATGLIHGVDKYCPDEDGTVNPKQFRSTIIGVMGGLMILSSSETTLHFFPQDRRKLYRANKIIGKLGPLIDFQEIADAVNIDPIDMIGTDFVKNPTNADEIAEILAAASTVSADSLSGSNDSNFDLRPEPITRFAAPDSCRPDVQTQERNDTQVLFNAMNGLSIFEQKLLRLKGVRDLV